MIVTLTPNPSIDRAGVLVAAASVIALKTLESRKVDIENLAPVA